MMWKKIFCMVIGLSAASSVLWAEESDTRISSIQSLLMENMAIFIAASPDSGSDEERRTKQAGFYDMRDQMFELADGDAKIVSKGIVRFLISREFRANVHPMVAGALVMDPEELWKLPSEDLLRAFIELSPYPDDYARDWAIGLFQYPHSLARPSDAPTSAIIPDLLEWLDEYGVNNSPESAFIVQSVLRSSAYYKHDALQALLEYTDTTGEVLDEWRASSIEELKLPTTSVMMNRYLCSKNLWVRLFGLNYVRDRSSWRELLKDESCLNDEAEHPLEARWAAELKAKLEAEAAKENAEAEAEKSAAE